MVRTKLAESVAGRSIRMPPIITICSGVYRAAPDSVVTLYLADQRKRGFSRTYSDGGGPRNGFPLGLEPRTCGLRVRKSQPVLASANPYQNVPLSRDFRRISVRVCAIACRAVSACPLEDPLEAKLVLGSTSSRIRR